MNGELFVQICLGVISIIGAIAAAYVIPFIKTKISATEMQKLIEYVNIAVRCAEQIYTVEQWLDKKEYVMKEVIEFMNNKLRIELSYDQIDTIVEGVVNEVKQWKVYPAETSYYNETQSVKVD